MRTWKLPADVDTDQLAPGHAMKHGLDVIARHCLERVRPEFAAQVQRGDVIVAGPNFGIGSSREQAASVLVHLGVAAVIAPSYSGLFHRNAFNVGLLLLTCPEADRIEDGEAITFDARAGQRAARQRRRARLQTHLRSAARPGRCRRPAESTQTTEEPVAMSKAPQHRSVDPQRARRATARQRGARGRHRGEGWPHRQGGAGPGCEERENGLRRQGPPGLPWRGRCAHARRHLLAAGRRRGQREPGGGDGRRDVEPQLLSHRAVLPEQGRPVQEVLSGSARAREGSLPRRLRVPPRADGPHAHRRAADADQEARRGQLQDLHVLRLARAARRQRFAAPVSDDRRGRALRRGALRIHHARPAEGARAVPGQGARRSRCRCTARRPRS